MSTTPLDSLFTRLDRIEAIQEENTRQIARLTEAVTVGFGELKAITQQQAEVAKQQAESISRLISLLEKK